MDDWALPDGCPASPLVVTMGILGISWGIKFISDSIMMFESRPYAIHNVIISGTMLATYAFIGLHRIMTILNPSHHRDNNNNNNGNNEEMRGLVRSPRANDEIINLRERTPITPRSVSSLRHGDRSRGTVSSSSSSTSLNATDIRVMQCVVAFLIFFSVIAVPSTSVSFATPLFMTSVVFFSHVLVRLQSALNHITDRLFDQ